MGIPLAFVPVLRNYSRHERSISSSTRWRLAKSTAPPPGLLQQALSGQWLAEGQAAPPPDPLPLIQRGLMPALLRLDTEASWARWWDGYVATYLERDLRQVSQIDALVDFRRVMELLALRSGQLLNQSGLARDAALSQPTVHRYLNLLETTHLFERVLARLMTPPARLHTWRTVQGQEVDFVLEHGRKALAIEVKLAGHPNYGDAGGLRAFLAAHPGAAGGLLLHGGTAVRRLDERILAAPWNMVTG